MAQPFSSADGSTANSPNAFIDEGVVPTPGWDQIGALAEDAAITVSSDWLDPEARLD